MPRREHNRRLRGAHGAGAVGRQRAPTLSLARKQIVDWHRPAGKNRLRVAAFAATKDGGIVRTARTVRPDDLLLQRIDVPDDERPGRKIVRAFLRHRTLGRGPVLFATPHFDGKEWSAFHEPIREGLRAKRNVGTERPPVRKADDEADAVAERVSAFRLLLVAQKGSRQFAG